MLRCHLKDSVDSIWVGSKSHPDRDAFHLHERALVPREILLPPRVLAYTSQQLFYTCRTTQWNEHLISKTDPGFLFQNLEPWRAKELLFPTSSSIKTPKFVEQVLEQWYFVVKAYAERNLTFETDQLPALAGIAKIVGRLTGYSIKLDFRKKTYFEVFYGL
jgi:hypothetical protein